MTKEDLVQIKEVVETIVNPRFDRIDEKLAEHDALLEGIVFTLDRQGEDIQELKTDIKIIKADAKTLKPGQQAGELRLERLETKVYAA